MFLEKKKGYHFIINHRGVEMPRGHSYSMTNQAVQPYFSIEQDA